MRGAALQDKHPDPDSDQQRHELVHSTWPAKSGFLATKPLETAPLGGTGLHTRKIVLLKRETATRLFRSDGGTLAAPSRGMYFSIKWRDERARQIVGKDIRVLAVRMLAHSDNLPVMSTIPGKAENHGMSIT